MCGQLTNLGLAPGHGPLLPVLLGLLHGPDTPEQLKLAVVIRAARAVASNIVINDLLSLAHHLGCLLVKLDLWLVGPVPEQPLAPGEALGGGGHLPLLQRPPLEDGELLPGARLSRQVPLQPRLGARILPANTQDGHGDNLSKASPVQKSHDYQT